jgi:isopenicillin N synthase-like dioxygenase
VSERVAGKNLWADAPAELRPIIEKYMAEIMALGKNMFQIFALGLGLKPDYFDDKITFPIAQLRLLHYPAQDSVNTSETNLGIGKHCDYECLTILAQDNMGGLQIENLEGNWIEAPSIEGAYVINIGEMLTRWTNGLFKATPHRVVNIKGGSRYSIPFFFATNYDTNIKPLDVCITENNPVQFEAIKAGDYLLSRLKKIYG